MMSEPQKDVLEVMHAAEFTPREKLALLEMRTEYLSKINKVYTAVIVCTIWNSVAVVAIIVKLMS